MNENCLIAIALLFVAFLSAPYLLGGGRSTSRSQRTETGYLIRYVGRKRIYSHEYPLFVGEDALRKALATGDYTFTEDETREIPAGQQYKDERLN